MTAPFQTRQHWFYLPLSILGVYSSFPTEGMAQDLISLEQSAEDEITLRWSGGFSLFSSSDLSTWNEVAGATSPFSVSTKAASSEFYQLLLTPAATSLDIPTGIYTAGTGQIPLAGTLSPTFSRTEGLSVRVGTQEAEIIRGEDGSVQFRFENLPLALGSNSLTVEVSNATGTVETLDFDVTFDPIVANNVVTDEQYAYAALGGEGIAIMDLQTRNYTVLAPPSPSDSVDDISLDGDVLFTMDATGSDFLSSINVADPLSPTLASGPVALTADVFSGVSAANGRVVVSGGTSLLTSRSYSPTGVLANDVASMDLGIGQPDVLIAPDGELAYVSTDFFGTFNGQTFGITTLDLTNSPLNIVSRTGLVGAGFSAGFQAPANFPIESAISGATLVVAHGGGLSILNAADGALQNTIPAAALGFSAVNVDIVDQIAFVIGLAPSGSSMLAQIDLTNPSTPPAIQTLSGVTSATGVDANDDFIVIAANANGLQVIERSSE